MTGRTRLLAWEDSLNARDLGGYPAIDGRETRWGAIVRSDDLATLTQTGRAALVDYGIRSIVDLRMPFELDQSPNPFAQPGDHGIEYTNVSFIDPDVPPPDGFTTLADGYMRMLDRFASRVGRIMTTIARASEGGVLVHCVAGKDRTGLICALMLDLAGVDQETISADYAMSKEFLQPLYEEWLRDGSPEERAERERELAKYSPRAEIMLEVLERLHERYGGAEAYLIQAGVSPENIARLRERLLPSTPRS